MTNAAAGSGLQRMAFALGLPLIPGLAAIGLWRLNDAIAAAGLFDQTALAELIEIPLLVVALGAASIAPTLAGSGRAARSVRLGHSAIMTAGLAWFAATNLGTLWCDNRPGPLAVVTYALSGSLVAGSGVLLASWSAGRFAGARPSIGRLALAAALGAAVASIGLVAGLLVLFLVNAPRECAV
jgi:hypothetical protein